MEWSNLNLRRMYFGLFVLGTVIPNLALLPWLLENGLNAVLFWQHAFENRIASFFSLDVLLSTVVVCVASVSRLRNWQKVPVLLFCFVAGVSAALPLMLYFQTPENGFIQKRTL